MYIVYVLKSLKDYKTYTGYTDNIEKRLKEHNQGKVQATKNRRPFAILYLENFQELTEAKHREIYWKSGAGRRKLEKYFKEGFPPISGLNSSPTNPRRFSVFILSVTTTPVWFLKAQKKPSAKSVSAIAVFFSLQGETVFAVKNSADQWRARC